MPFYISCTTCKTRLKVRDESAVGEIHTCPRCGSMVMVTPPRPHQVSDSQGSDSSQDGVVTATSPSAADPALLAFTFDDAVEILNQDAGPPRQVSPELARPTSHTPAAALSHAPVKRVDQWADTVEELSPPADLTDDKPVAEGQSEDLHVTNVAPRREAAGLADTVDGETSTGIALPVEVGAVAAEETYLEPPPPAERWLAPSATVWRQWAILGGAATMGIVLAVAVFGYAVMHANRARTAVVADAHQKEGSAPPQAPAGENPAEAPEGFANQDQDSSLSEPPPAAGDQKDEEVAPKAPPDKADVSSQPAAGEESEKAAANPSEPARDAKADDLPAEAPKTETEETLAGGSDLLDKFGAFLGNSELVAPPPAVAAAPLAPATAPEPVELEASSQPSAEQTPLPRPAPRAVDVPTRLADPIEAIEFAGIPLTDFLTFVSDLSTIPITIEPEALAWRRLTPRTPVSVRQSKTTVEAALNAGLAPLGLGFVADDGHLRVTTVSGRDHPLRRITHPVGDLTGGDAKQLEELAGLIERLVAPESWKSAGGAGSLSAADGELSIEQSEGVHYRVIAFCESLRSARGLAPRTKFEQTLFQPQTQQKAARTKLATSISLNYRHPTELTTILDNFGKVTGFAILVDWRAAGEAGWPPGAKGSVVADKTPLNDALHSLLTPMDLTYRVVDGATLEITTPERLRSRLETEFYPVGDILAGKFTSATLLEQIRSEFGADRFGEGKGALYLDPQSQHLIVALPQPQQLELAALLGDWRSRK